MTYKFDRETIVKKIKESPITDDGYYFCKYFPRLNRLKGKKRDNNYIFDREYFKNKVVFSHADIETYLDDVGDINNIEKMQKKDIYIYSVIKDSLKNNLHSKIPNTQYTLGELIDATIYYFNYKYPF